MIRFVRGSRARPPGAGSFPRGLALRGAFWAGGDAAVVPDATVVVDAGGIVSVVAAGAVALPEGLPVLGGPGCWIGPGITDAHVHLAFGTPDAALDGGVTAVRDLGAPLGDALAWRVSGQDDAPGVRVAGPLLTAPGGYPSQSWGAGGFALFVDSPAAARAEVAALARDGVDLVKLALEPAGGAPVPSAAEARAAVDAAHEAGLPTTAHALTVAMVERALAAGIDELCHTPVEPLPQRLVDTIAAAGVTVVSTLATFFAGGGGETAAANAAALVAAGVPLAYGTDLGNAGTRPGVDPRELDRLAATGLGALGALRAATETSGRLLGRAGVVRAGAPASLVVLPRDPLADATAWLDPVAVVAGARVVTGS